MFFAERDVHSVFRMLYLEFIQWRFTEWWLTAINEQQAGCLQYGLDSKQDACITDTDN